MDLEIGCTVVVQELLGVNGFFDGVVGTNDPFKKIPHRFAPPLTKTSLEPPQLLGRGLDLKPLQ
jgi:hypothetical protein